MFKDDTCIRCEKAEPELGSYLCGPCQNALKNPEPPERPDQGMPVAKRSSSAFHKIPKGGWPR